MKTVEIFLLAVADGASPCSHGTPEAKNMIHAKTLHGAFEGSAMTLIFLLNLAGGSMNLYQSCVTSKLN